MLLFPLVPSASVLYGGTVCKCLLIDCEYYGNITTLTLTLMILLWKLLSTTMTSPASTGESVPSCLKHTQHYINTNKQPISTLHEGNTSAHNTANKSIRLTLSTNSLNRVHRFCSLSWIKFGVNMAKSCRVTA